MMIMSEKKAIFLKLWDFLIIRKKSWLLPMIIIIIIYIIIILLGQNFFINPDQDMRWLIGYDVDYNRLNHIFRIDIFIKLLFSQ